jgi:hypothetical protein
MWLPQEMQDEVMQEMQDKGLELGRDEIWNSAGTGIANAIVQMGKMGATGAFVSPEGLILTNHHVAFGSVQRMSTPDKNYIERGFLAKTRGEEVPALGYIAYVMQSSEDVTEKVFSEVKPAMTPLERYMAIEKRTKQIVKEAEARGQAAGSDIYCEVSSFFGGARYLLYTFLKIRDVRVVYVPARAIGEYGGDIDNWMWPRHTGDFSFLRAYVAPDGRSTDFSKDNVPYGPKRYLAVAPEGLKEGDFAFIIGFPRSTHRYLTSYALGDYEEFEFPERIRLDRQMVKILEEQSKADPAARVLVAGKMKDLNNYLKKNEGVLEGFRRSELVERQQAMEGEFRANLAKDPKMQAKYGTILDDFKSLYEERSLHAMKDLILEYATGEGLLGQAMLLYKWSLQKTRDDLDRDPRFMDREIPDLRRDLSIFQTSYDPASERAILKMLLQEMAVLPGGQRVRAFDAIFGKKTGGELEEEFAKFVGDLYSKTSLNDEQERLRMFDLSHAALLKEGDAFIAFAANLYEENEERIIRQKRIDGTLQMLTPKWIEAIEAQSQHEVYPDANSTMRFNYGVVAGYPPRDGVWYEPFTTLRGVVEKNTGIAPFNCPAKILRLAANRTYGPYIDRDFDDVPVDLLTTHDSTNGNSGSPLLNSRGQLVGCLFDGNYEAVSGDFAFDETLHRSISVDIRYVLWVADCVDGARNVLEELGVK